MYFSRYADYKLILQYILFDSISRFYIAQVVTVSRYFVSPYISVQHHSQGRVIPESPGRVTYHSSVNVSAI